MARSIDIVKDKVEQASKGLEVEFTTLELAEAIVNTYEDLVHLRERARIVGINFWFHTTRDDKDDQDVVTVSLVRHDGQQVGAPIHLGAGNKWDNDTTVGPFFIGIAAQQSSKLDMLIAKTGTDGWIFQGTIAGVLEGGGQVVLIDRTEEILFEDDSQSTVLRLP